MVRDEPAGTATFDQVEDLQAILAPVMRAVATAVGEHCEVVLHDLSSRDMGHTICAIENGHVSDRAVGGPSTNLGLEVLADEHADHDAHGYFGRTADGRDLHCSSVYFRDSAGSVIAALCVNVDLTDLQQVRTAVESLIPRPSESPKELVTPDITSLLDEMIETAIARVGKPVPLMGKEDRIAVLRYLEEKGAFFVKRSMTQVTDRLAISRVTGYAYLEEIRSST